MELQGPLSCSLSWASTWPSLCVLSQPALQKPGKILLKPGKISNKPVNGELYSFPMPPSPPSQEETRVRAKQAFQEVKEQQKHTFLPEKADPPEENSCQCMMFFEALIED